MQADKIFIYGAGRSGLIGKAFAIRLVQLGLNVFFLGETTTPFVTDKDMALIISHTGETMSCIQSANIIRRVGANVVVVTGNQTSKLAHAGSLVINLEPKKDAKKDALAPLGTLFEDAVLIFLDGVVATLIEEMGENEAKMKSRHPILV